MQRKSGISTRDAAELLGISESTLRNWDKNGTLRAHRGDGKKRIYFIKDIQKFAETTKKIKKKAKAKLAP